MGHRLDTPETIAEPHARVFGSSPTTFKGDTAPLKSVPTELDEGFVEGTRATGAARAQALLQFEFEHEHDRSAVMSATRNLLAMD